MKFVFLIPLFPLLGFLFNFLVGVRALRQAQRLAGNRGLVIAAGSIFLMAAVLAKLLGMKSDPPIAM